MEHRGLGPDAWPGVPREIRRLLRDHGDEWAASLRPRVISYSFELGLVARVGMTGDAFVDHGAAVAREAPIVALALTAPIDFAKVASSPVLAQIRELGIMEGEWLDDAAIDQLARSPYLRELRAFHVSGGALTHRGLSRLASMELPNLIYINVRGNPGAASFHPSVTRIHDKKHIIGRAGEPLLGEAIAATALGYSGQAEWPPVASTYLFDNDE